MHAELSLYTSSKHVSDSYDNIERMSRFRNLTEVYTTKLKVLEALRNEYLHRHKSLNFIIMHTVHLRNNT